MKERFSRFALEHIEHGDTVSEVLDYVHFDSNALLDRVNNAADKAIESGTMNASEKAMLLERYRDGLQGYTYFE